jgi:hypothetical protein
MHLFVIIISLAMFFGCAPEEPQNYNDTKDNQTLIEPEPLATSKPRKENVNQGKPSITEAIIEKPRITEPIIDNPPEIIVPPKNTTEVKKTRAELIALNNQEREKNIQEIIKHEEDKTALVKELLSSPLEQANLDLIKMLINAHNNIKDREIFVNKSYGDPPQTLLSRFFGRESFASNKPEPTELELSLAKTLLEAGADLGDGKEFRDQKRLEALLKILNDDAKPGQFARILSKLDIYIASQIVLDHTNKPEYKNLKTALKIDQKLIHHMHKQSLISLIYEDALMKDFNNTIYNKNISPDQRFFSRNYYYEEKEKLFNNLVEQIDNLQNFTLSNAEFAGNDFPVLDQFLLVTKNNEAFGGTLLWTIMRKISREYMVASNMNQNPEAFPKNKLEASIRTIAQLFKAKIGQNWQKYLELRSTHAPEENANSESALDVVARLVALTKTKDEAIINNIIGKAFIPSTHDIKTAKNWLEF